MTSSRRADCAVTPLDDLEGGHRLCLALDPHLVEHLVRDVRTGEPPGVLTDQHPTGLARRFQPCRSVQHVTDQVDIVAPDHQLAGVDAHPQVEFDAVALADLVGERPEPALQFDSGGHRAKRVVLGDLGHTEQREHAVTEELDHGTGVVVDRRLQQCEVGRQTRSDGFGIDSLGERRRTHQIGEQCRDTLARGARRGGGRAESAGEWRSAGCRTRHRTSLPVPVRCRTLGTCAPVACRIPNRTWRSAGCRVGTCHRSCVFAPGKSSHDDARSCSTDVMNDVTRSNWACHAPGRGPQLRQLGCHYCGRMDRAGGQR